MGALASAPELAVRGMVGFPGAGRLIYKSGKPIVWWRHPNKSLPLWKLMMLLLKCARTLPLLWCLLISAAVLVAQEKARPQYSVRVDLVSLDVEILDRMGRPVSNLSKADFVVTENNKQMELSNFAWQSDRSVSLAIVLDTSAISQEKVSIAKQFISNLAHLLARDDELALYTFDIRDAYLEMGFSRDRRLLTGALENIGVTSKNKNSFLKGLFGATPKIGLAVDLALYALDRSANDKRALLVVSNRFKGLGPGTVDHVRNFGHTVLTLSFGNKASAIFSFGDQINKGQIHRDSGGRDLTLNAENISSQCRKVAFSLKNHYSLGYLTKIDPQETKSRKIRVTLPNHDYLVYARRTYKPER